jgi:hypothetical protein
VKNLFKLTLFILLCSSCAGVSKKYAERAPASEPLPAFILPESETCFLVLKEFIGPEMVFGSNHLKSLKDQLNLNDRFMENLKREDQFREIASLHYAEDEQEKAWLVIGSLKRKNPEADATEIKKLYKELLNPCD